MTLLTIVQGAAARCGLAQPSSVVSNTDETAVRLLSLTNAAGKALARRHNWSVLTKEKTFTTTAAAVQASAIPTDFDRFVDETLFNRTRKRRLTGPISAEEWQVQQALSASVLIDAFRIRGADMLITPTPAAGETIAYEYVSKYWVDTDADGDGDAVSFASDSYTSILDEEMLTLDVIWRYRASVGLNYAEAFREAQLMVADRIAGDGGRRTLNLATEPMIARPQINIQEGSWPL